MVDGEFGRISHLGAAVDSGPQAQGNEALNGVGQVGVLQMIIEH